MHSIINIPLAVLLCSCLQRHRSTAFPRPRLLPVRGARAAPPRDVRVAAAAIDDDAHGRDDDGRHALLSRHALFRRTVRGAALAVAASVTDVERGNAVPGSLPTVSVSLASEKEGGAKTSGSKAMKPVKPLPLPSRKLGLATKILSISHIMDELQRDIMEERCDLMSGYPNQLRSYVPILRAYTDGITDVPRLRVALREEVGRFFVALERFRTATGNEALDQAFVAYADMSLHFDCYLRKGGLYRFFDDRVDRDLYGGLNANPQKDPAGVRDLVVLVKGPDRGRTGIVIGIYPDGSGTCAVKLDRSRGVREIRVVDRSWAGKRKGPQDPDEVFSIPRNG